MQAVTWRDVLNHLMKGGKFRDQQNYEPGLCSNGGRYRQSWRLVKDYRPIFSLETRSSYEDDDWQMDVQTQKELLEFCQCAAASLNSGEKSWWGDWDAFTLD